jgi:ABC-type glycerol-3-phosphate transport system substrate-binding protein
MVALMAALLVSAGVAAACSGTDDPVVDSPSTSAPATAPSPVVTTPSTAVAAAELLALGCG